ncbi:hypothetical protein SAMN05192534_101569 [Alteribacillus persepolensis]|uniref:Uncharacterized protein n=1 Tax=Alteribacillus persepolensis TaxID=568899 RepID=A0A1G7ZJP5_9BACI|nr:hypothetical protein [Alteribacillus persepolensis]SDH08776.1 hypothetical protein SAMN05192534_101569 [Alteribacillus persepolensis]
MLLNKLKCRSLVTDDDVRYNFRLGIPVEVYCVKAKSTLVFGRIEHYNKQYICVAGHWFHRDRFIFFGQRHLEKISS